MWQQMQNWYKITNPWSNKSNYTSGILKVTETVNTILFAVLFTLAYMVIKPSFIIVSLTHLNEFTILAVLMEERFWDFFEMIFLFCTFRGTLLQKWTHMLRTAVPETVVKWQEEMKANQKLYGIKGCFMSLSERKVRHKTVILWSEVKEVWNICIQIIWSKDNAKNNPIYIIIWFRHRHNSACNSVNATRLTT